MFGKKTKKTVTNKEIMDKLEKIEEKIGAQHSIILGRLERRLRNLGLGFKHKDENKHVINCTNVHILDIFLLF